MTQLILNIEDNALVPILKGIVSRMSGVSILDIPKSLITTIPGNDNMTHSSLSKKNKENRINAMKEIKNKNFDASLIDINDERTNYIMSK